MKKAVIKSGSKQFIVSEKETIKIDYIGDDQKTLSFDPLMIIDGTTYKIGEPTVKGAKVTANVVEAKIQEEKTTSIRYKAKKRVRKIRGHRQLKTKIEITKIS